MKTSPITRLARALLCLALLNQTTALAQQPQPTPRPTSDDEVIKLNTELVQLRAVVTDRKGQIVENLSKDDFAVSENGQPREVSFFSVERAPGSAAPTAPGANGGTAAARTPSVRAAAAPPSRTIVLFVDTLHLAPDSLMRVKTQLKKFVDEQMTDGDLVAVVASSGTLGILQQFTRDRRILKYAIDKISLFTGLHTSITPFLASRAVVEDPQALNQVLSILAAEEGYVRMNATSDNTYAASRAREFLAQAAALQRSTLRVLGAVSEQLARLRGQRLIAFVSDGFSLYDDGGSTDRAGLEAAESRATRAGVMIYPVYAKGLVAPSGADMGSSYSFESEQDVQANLRELAQATGGEAHLNTNDLRAPLRQMLDANRVYYALAYYLPKDSDKKFRRINVAVRNHPEYTVRTQRGYTPAADAGAEVATTPRQKLFQQMIAPLPATNLGVTASADFLEVAGDDAQVTLQVHIDANRLQYERQGDNSLLRCEVAAVVFDEAGKIVDGATITETINATLTPAQLEAARREGYRYTRRIRLKPGLYQARVGVREVGSELTGTSVSWVEVPDLGKGKLTLSSLFLGKAAGAPASSSGAKGVSPKLLVGNASIKSGDVIFYRFVAYDAAAQTGADATMKVDILQGDKALYDGGWQPLAARVLRRDAKGAEAGGQLKAELPPGVYTLRVSVKDGASNKTAERTADFEVEP
ncbi:MAG: VWA domain-containing protein [Pyrinomonadaceae bacterium]